MKLVYPPEATTSPITYAQQVVELVSGHPSSRYYPLAYLVNNTDMKFIKYIFLRK